MNTSKIMSRKALPLAVSLLALSVSGGAIAATDSFDVTATVVENCTVTAANLGFGNYDPIVANTTADIAANADLTVTCTDGSAVSIALDNGGNFDTGRRLISGANFLNYELYQEVGHTTVWGGANEVAHSGTGAAQAVTVYGNLPGAQNVPVGAYSDTILVTITL